MRQLRVGTAKHAKHAKITEAEIGNLGKGSIELLAVEGFGAEDNEVTDKP